jgi:hypothetical protein
MSDYADETSRISDLIRQYRDVPLEDFGDVVEEEKQQDQAKRATDLSEYMDKWKTTQEEGGEELGGVVAFEGAIKMKNKVKSIYDKYKEARKKVNEIRKRLGRKDSEEEDEEDPDGFGGAEEEEETPEGFGGAEEDEDIENEEEETAPENPEVDLPRPTTPIVEGQLIDEDTPIPEGTIEIPASQVQVDLPTDRPPAQLDTFSEDFSSRASQLRARLNDLQTKLKEGTSKTPLEEQPVAEETPRLQLTPRDPEAPEVSGAEQFDDPLPRIRSFDPSLESISEETPIASVSGIRRTIGDPEFGVGESRTTITRLAPQQFEPAPTRITTRPIAESELPEPSLPDVIARPIQEGGTEIRSALTGTGEAEGYAPNLLEGIGSRASSLIRGIGSNLLDTIKTRGQAVSQAVTDAKNFISRPASEVTQDIAGRVGGETAGKLAGGLAEGVGADTGEAIAGGVGEAVLGSIPVLGEVGLIVTGLVKLGEGIYHLFHPKKEKAKAINTPQNIAMPVPQQQLTAKFAQALPSIDTANDVSASVMSF